MSEQKMLTVGDIQRIYGMHRQALYYARKTGTGPPYVQVRRYGNVEYYADEFDRWYKENREIKA